MKRTFNYVNGLGHHKRLVVEDIPKDDRLYFLLFEKGEIHGEGFLLRQEINQILEQYNITERV